MGIDETLDEEIYGLAGIAFDTYGTGSDMVTSFINVQSHRKWIETFKWSLGEKDKLELWSRSDCGKKIGVFRFLFLVPYMDLDFLVYSQLRTFHFQSKNMATLQKLFYL